MNHQPTQLALLISLIGIGAAPHANASASLSARLDTPAIDALTLGAIRSLPDPACDALEAAVLPACGANTQLTWLPPRDPLDRTATAGVRVLYSSVARDDWALGETGVGLGTESAPPGRWVPSEGDGAAVNTANEAREPVRQSARKSSAKHAAKQAGKTTRKVRVFAQVPASARVQMPPRSHDDASTSRIEPLPAIAHVAETSSTHLDRLLDRLVGVSFDAPAAPSADRRPQAAVESAGPAGVPIEPLAIAPQPVVAASPSAEVLRQLGAILAEERDEVGAIPRQESQAVVTTQTGKVLGMLGEIVGAQPQAEDGPARRLRKLAARAVKANADAAAAVSDAAAALVADVARGGVDLLLPLEPQAPVPSAPAARPARTNPFGDRRVALADASLDRVRGGFSADGLSISFGIERAVYVNGALVTTTSLNVSDLGRITAGRGTTAFDVGTIGLIQSGAGNVVSPTMISAGSVGTVIQNTLDGQKIQNVTIINATTNSLGLLRGLNLQSSLRGAVIDSLRR